MRGYKSLFDLLANTSFTAILTDHNLATATGIDFAMYIRKELGPNQHVPIVMQTSDANAKLNLKAQEVGIHSVIAKPNGIATSNDGDRLAHALEDAIAEQEKPARKIV